MSYSIRCFLYQSNTQVYFHPSELACWKYSSEMAWNERNRVWTLEMGGSGSSGIIRFQGLKADEKFYIVLGVHNYVPWLDVVADVGNTVTAVGALPEYYNDGPKARVREATHKTMSVTNAQGRKITATFAGTDSHNIDLNIVVS